MQRAKAFFIVCAGVFLLALAYHLGASIAGAQAPGNPVVGLVWNTTQGVWGAVTANGDTYMSNNVLATWSHQGNVFSAQTPTQPTTFGAIKAKSRN